MSITIEMMPSRVAHAMGDDPKGPVACDLGTVKAVWPASRCFKADGLPRSPFPPAESIPGDTGLAGGAR